MPSVYDLTFEQIQQYRIVRNHIRGSRKHRADYESLNPVTIVFGSPVCLIASASEFRHRIGNTVFLTLRERNEWVDLSANTAMDWYKSIWLMIETIMPTRFNASGSDRSTTADLAMWYFTYGCESRETTERWLWNGNKVALVDEEFAGTCTEHGLAGDWWFSK